VRRTLRVSCLVVAVAAMASMTFVSSAGAGLAPILDAPLTIVKTVSGTVPAGTTFTVNLHCPDGNIDTGAESDAAAITDTDATVTFDASGQPTSPDTIGFDGEGTCTVTETANGGASSVTYACEGTIPPIDSVKGFGGVSAQQELPTDPCESAGPQAAPISVLIVEPDQEATVTVHNTFTDPVQPPIQPAPQIVARPLFTG
jgi:hypothetical protein